MLKAHAWCGTVGRGFAGGAFGDFSESGRTRNCRKSAGFPHPACLKHANHPAASGLIQELSYREPLLIVVL